MNSLVLFDRLKKFPFGKSIFTHLVCRRLPYFFSIRPSVLEYAHGRSVVQMKQRRSVENHLQTIHAIAMCNLCELSMAMTVSATIPPSLRFIPVGMTVSYKKKARGTLTAVSQIKVEDFKAGNVDLPVDVTDESGASVMSAVITINVKDKA